MCFSPEASFAAGTALLGAGAYCTAQALRRNPAYVPLAAIPAVFGIQQGLEGLVWIGLGQDRRDVVIPASLAYLFFALAFWPAWFSFSLFFIESRRWVRLCLLSGAILGVVWSTLVYVPLLLNPTAYVDTRIVHHAIFYDLRSSPAAQWLPRLWLKLGYSALGIFPFFVCTNRDYRRFGFLLIGAAVISYLVFHHAFASVWCFFAALLSIYLCYVLHKLPVSHPARWPGAPRRRIAGLPASRLSAPELLQYNRSAATNPNRKSH